MNTDVGSAIGS